MGERLAKRSRGECAEEGDASAALFRASATASSEERVEGIAPTPEEREREIDAEVNERELFLLKGICPMDEKGGDAHRDDQRERRPAGSEAEHEEYRAEDLGKNREAEGSGRADPEGVREAPCADGEELEELWEPMGEHEPAASEAEEQEPEVLSS